MFKNFVDTQRVKYVLKLAYGNKTTNYLLKHT